MRPEKRQAIADWMTRLGVSERDLEESFVLGSGSGGQKRQKTKNCVVLRHLPSKTVIKYGKSRSRELNRLLARRALCEKLDPDTTVENKIRKQKNRRKRRAALKFLCDEMLKKLAGWLRAAGYDTEVATLGASKEQLFKQAKKEKRLLITCDRHFLEIDPKERSLLYLSSSDQKVCAHELANKVSIDWRHKPFSRCFNCNAPLTHTLEDDLKNISDHEEQCRSCTCCEQLDLKSLKTLQSLRLAGDPANEREEKEPDSS